MFNYISNSTEHKLNKVVKNNIDLLADLKGICTDTSMFLLNQIPGLFRLPIIAVDEAISYNRGSPVWQVIDSVFFGTLGFATSVALTAFNIVGSALIAPFALVFDGIPCLFSKNYRTQLKLTRKVRKLNNILGKVIPKPIDYDISRKHKKLSNIIYRLNPLKEEKILKLINEVEVLNKQLGRDVVEEKPVTITNFVSDNKTMITSNTTINQNTNQTIQEIDRSL